MKKINTILSTLFLLSTILTFGQRIGINTDESDPDPSAILDVKSSTNSPTPKVIEAEQFSISQPLRDMVSTSAIGTDAEERESDLKKYRLSQ